MAPLSCLKGRSWLLVLLMAVRLLPYAPEYPEHDCLPALLVFGLLWPPDAADQLWRLAALLSLVHVLCLE